MHVLLLLASLAALQGQGDASALAERLAGMTAVTGLEQQVVDSLLAIVPSARRDRAGSAVVTLGSGAPHRLIVCPVDEPGYVVGGVRDDGYLTLRRVGVPTSALFDQWLEAHRVTVWTKRGPVPGVVAVPSTHLARGRRGVFDEVFTVDDALVELGAASSTELAGLGVHVIDPVALTKHPQRYGHGLLAAPMAARRAACAALAAALHEAPRVRGTVVAVFAVESEIRHRGLLTARHISGPFAATLLVGYGVPNRLLDSGFGAVERASLDARYAGTPVETVRLADVTALEQRIRVWMGGGQ